MPEIVQSIVMLGIGVPLLLYGGEVLVRGSVTLASRLGVSPLVIGLTVVAFGTSSPELAFNVVAASSGNDELSFGNIIGSNIANIGLVLAVAAMIRPMKVHGTVVRREMPVMLAVTVLAAMLLALPWGGGVFVKGAGLSRPDAVVLLVVFAAFLVMNLWSARHQRRAPTPGEDYEEVSDADVERPMWRAVVFVLLGLALLVGGGRLSELGAVGVATALGLSKTVIGLTVVAVATSLPELVTSVVAARRGQSDIAVGNVVGSNVFNLTLVLGTTAAVRPMELPAFGVVSLLVMLLLSALVWPMSRTDGRVLTRVEAGALLLVYAVYLTVEVVYAQGGLGPAVG